MRSPVVVTSEVLSLVRALIKVASLREQYIVGWLLRSLQIRPTGCGGQHWAVSSQKGSNVRKRVPEFAQRRWPPPKHCLIWLAFAIYIYIYIYSIIYLLSPGSDLGNQPAKLNGKSCAKLGDCMSARCPCASLLCECVRECSQRDVKIHLVVVPRFWSIGAASVTACSVFGRRARLLLVLRMTPTIMLCVRWIDFSSAFWDVSGLLF
jgi:hypothetical protein